MTKRKRIEALEHNQNMMLNKIMELERRLYALEPKPQADDKGWTTESEVVDGWRSYPLARMADVQTVLLSTNGKPVAV